ncbi:2-hydroxy-3-oxopropionate reductase-like [Homarus americanus]|uniref:2-hydroxy-3-oxopropionate reductase-like n=1 Tax=Homarus americanus TaxID=6706 RepID=UPI001C47891E|nr:2-hydroxy-3-oxopropionate reductase-like [Homarus americanus]
MFRCVRACVHLSRCTRVGRRGLHGASQATTVGVVGCGNVGAAVSHNLHRQGFRVVGAYDPDPARYADLPPGVTCLATPRKVAEAADVIVTGLPRPPNVKEAAEGPDGILAGLSKDKVWIDHSTTDSDQTMVYSEEAQKVGAYVLEAPITGGLASLKKGQMVVHLGGDKRVADAMTPLLNASYSKVFYVGEIGTAMMVKVISNMLACVHIIAMGEVLMLGKRAQLDLKTLWQAIRVSAGNSFVWETGAPLVFTGSYDPGFTMALQNKDLQLGYDMARKYEVPMDMHLLALAIYRRTQYQLGDDAGCYSPPRTYELALGESLNIRDFENWTYDSEVYKGSLVVGHNGLEE